MFEMRKSSQESHERKPKAQGLSLIANSHIPRNSFGQKKGNSGLYHEKTDVNYPDTSPIGDSSDDSSEARILHTRGYLRGRAM